MPMIKMLSTHDGSVDGHTLQPYYQGQVYQLCGVGGEDLARSFIQAGWAELVEEILPDAPGPQQNAAAPPPQAPTVAEKPHKPPAGGKR